MALYAANTSVSPERSRAEIEASLARYGADSFGYFTDHGKAVVMFKANKRAIRIVIEHADGSKLKRKPGKWQREITDTQRAKYESDESRRRWRALLLVIKAKLEAVASGIATFEDEFLPYTVMPSGQTVGEWARPQMETMQAGNMMPMLPQTSSAK